MQTQALRNLNVNASWDAQSGGPYTITTGTDDNGDSIFNDRPALVPRNSARLPWRSQLNANVSYTIPIGARPAETGRNGRNGRNVNDGGEGTACRAALAMAVASLEARDRATAAHSDDVVTLSESIGTRLGLSDEQLARLAAAAQLHDVGKLAMPTEILSKPGPLDDDEWAVIREHTVIGERMLRAVPEMGAVAGIVRHYAQGGSKDPLQDKRIRGFEASDADALHIGLAPWRGWAPDELHPENVLEAADKVFANGWSSLYPPLHFYLLNVVLLPFRTLDGWTTARLDEFSTQAVIHVVMRAVSVVMALLTLFVTALLARATVGRAGGVHLVST